MNSSQQPAAQQSVEELPQSQPLPAPGSTYTPVPTYTPMPTYTPIPTETPNIIIVVATLTPVFQSIRPPEIGGISSNQPSIPDTNLFDNLEITEVDLNQAAIWELVKTMLEDIGLWEVSKNIVSMMIIVIIVFMALSYLKG